jgi:hypothetical protein
MNLLDAEHHYKASDVPKVHCLAPLLVPAIMTVRRGGQYVSRADDPQNEGYGSVRPTSYATDLFPIREEKRRDGGVPSLPRWRHSEAHPRRA